MKTWKDIAKERLAFAKEMQALLARRVSVWQTMLYIRLFNVFSTLETDADGKLKFTPANQFRIAQLTSIFRQFGEAVKNGEYDTAGKRKGGLMEWLLGRVDILIGLNVDYVSKVTPTVPAADRAREIVLTQLGFDPVTKTVLPGSLLGDVSQHGNVKTKVMQRIQQALAVGTSLSDFRRDFRDDFLDTKTGLGLLSKHYKLHTGNIFASLDRQISETLAEDTGLEYWVFSGTIVTNTREWCEGKVGKVFHKSIFNDWNKQTWVGKIPNADVRIVLGGHGPCRHQKNFISAQMAKRMINGGRAHGLTPEQFQKLFK
jgi:hypothetical protein